MRLVIILNFLIVVMSLSAQKRLTDVQSGTLDAVTSFERNDSLFVAQFNGQNLITITYYDDQLKPQLIKTIELPTGTYNILYSQGILLFTGNISFLYNMDDNRLLEIEQGITTPDLNVEVYGNMIVLHNTISPLMYILESSTGRIYEYQKSSFINIVDDNIFLYKKDGHRSSFWLVNNDTDSLFLGALKEKPNTLRIVNDTLYYILDGDTWQQPLDGKGKPTLFSSNYPQNRTVEVFVGANICGYQYNYYEGSTKKFVLDYYSNSRIEPLVSLDLTAEVDFIYGNDDYFLFFEGTRHWKYDIHTGLLIVIFESNIPIADRYSFKHSDALFVLTIGNTSYYISTATWDIHIYSNRASFQVFDNRTISTSYVGSEDQFLIQVFDPIVNEEINLVIPAKSNSGLRGDYLNAPLYVDYHSNADKDVYVLVNQDTSFTYLFEKKSSINYIADGDYYQILEIKSDREIRVYHYTRGQNEIKLMDSIKFSFDIGSVKGFGKYIKILSTNMTSNSVITTLDDLSTMYSIDFYTSPLNFKDKLVFIESNDLVMLDGVGRKIILTESAIDYKFVTFNNELYGIGSEIIKYNENTEGFDAIGINFDHKVKPSDFKEVVPGVAVWSVMPNIYIFDSQEVLTYPYEFYYFANDKILMYNLSGYNLSSKVAYYDLVTKELIITNYLRSDFNGLIRNNMNQEFMEVYDEESFTMYSLDENLNKLDPFFIHNYSTIKYGSGFFVGDYYVYIPDSGKPIIKHPCGLEQRLPYNVSSPTYYVDGTDLWLNLFTYEHGNQLYYIDFSHTPIITKPLENQQKIKLYPNPASHCFFINLDRVDSYTILNQQGAKVASGEGVRVDVSALVNGIYYLVAYTGNDRVTAKFVKQE